ncbi:unnamed protein product [Moneuplotes crassus]|uniref:Uncharacterized protein n=1 Tax=Euplotes crassus TaxID=5936 RepID=A0AAD1XXZ0_EUPCR|nr:unnamed protein product [Moneuplotes crassus]
MLSFDIKQLKIKQKRGAKLFIESIGSKLKPCTKTRSQSVNKSTINSKQAKGNRITLEAETDRMINDIVTFCNNMTLTTPEIRNKTISDQFNSVNYLKSKVRKSRNDSMYFRNDSGQSYTNKYPYGNISTISESSAWSPAKDLTTFDFSNVLKGPEKRKFKLRSIACSKRFSQSYILKPKELMTKKNKDLFDKTLNNVRRKNTTDFSQFKAKIPKKRFKLKAMQIKVPSYETLSYSQKLEYIVLYIKKYLKLKDKEEEVNTQGANKDRDKKVIQTLKNLCAGTGQFQLKFYSCKILGDYYLENQKIQLAEECYLELKKESESQKQNYETMVMYAQLSYCARLKNEHEKALRLAKNLLKNVWVVKENTTPEQRQEMELQAYFIMAYEHFYLGNFKKFKFYMHRYEKGICEDDNSMLKKLFEEAELSRKKAIERLSKAGESLRHNLSEVVNLPSPSQSTSNGLNARSNTSKFGKTSLSAMKEYGQTTLGVRRENSVQGNSRNFAIKEVHTTDSKNPKMKNNRLFSLFFDQKLDEKPPNIYDRKIFRGLRSEKKSALCGDDYEKVIQKANSNMKSRSYSTNIANLKKSPLVFDKSRIMLLKKPSKSRLAMIKTHQNKARYEAVNQSSYSLKQGLLDLIKMCTVLLERK